MKRILLLATALGGCVAAGPVPQDALPQGVMQLVSVDGKAPGYSATLNLATPGQAGGQAPCNGYGADLDWQGESFTLGPIISTQRACLQIKGEAEFFQLMQGVTQASRTTQGVELRGSGHVLDFQQ